MGNMMPAIEFLSDFKRFDPFMSVSYPFAPIKKEDSFFIGVILGQESSLNISQAKEKAKDLKDRVSQFNNFTPDQQKLIAYADSHGKGYGYMVKTAIAIQKTISLFMGRNEVKDKEGMWIYPIFNLHISSNGSLLNFMEASPSDIQSSDIRLYQIQSGEYIAFREIHKYQR